MSKLKIGFVLDDGLDSTDGVQQYILTLGIWLTAQGHDVHYLVGHTIRTDIASVHSLSRNIPTIFNRNRGTSPLPASGRRIKKLLSDTQFDVLHVQMPYSPFMAQRVVSRADARTAVIGTFHILPHSRVVMAATRGLGVWLTSSLKRFDYIVSVSPAAAEFARQSFRVESQVVPNAVDVAKFANAIPDLDKPTDKLRVLFLGRLVPRKGCMYLLEAVKKLMNSHDNVPPFEVMICGKGPLEAELKRFVAEHHLSDHVIFTGFVSEADKPRYYASADIAVFPSTGGESFGIVLVEAMASGKAAVLAGDNPGYRSAMGKCPELLFMPKNTDELAAKLYHFMTDKAARLDAAKWCKVQAATYDVGVVGKKLVHIYEEALRLRRAMT